MTRASVFRPTVGIAVLVTMLVTAAYAIDCNIFPDCEDVGIGTQSPQRKLHVKAGQSGLLNYPVKLDCQGTGANTGLFIETILSTQFGAFQDATNTYSFRVNNGTATKLYVGTGGTYDGRIGLGTTTPSSAITIVGPPPASGAVISLEDPDPLPVPSAKMISLPRFACMFGGYNEAARTSFQVRDTYDNSLLWIGTSGMFQGNVGIGTTIPGYKLEVNGTVKAREVVISSQGWPDYVFRGDYALPTLDEVEVVIRRDGHLPDLPTAKDVAANGVGVGEMQMRLLQKIEELTLYTIDLKKQNELLERRLQALDATAQIV